MIEISSHYFVSNEPLPKIKTSHFNVNSDRLHSYITAHTLKEQIERYMYYALMDIVSSKLIFSSA